ncbi:MAG: hypothetical protein ACHQRM_01835 [Bacteroidia bacterium]
MKNIYQGLISLFLLCILISCGQKSNERNEATLSNSSADKEAGLKIETKDVKGKLIAGEHAKAGNGTLVNDEGTFEEATINFDHKAGINIYPSKQPFDTLVSRLKEKLKNWGTFDVLEKQEQVFYYKATRVFGAQKEEGFNFLVQIKGKNHTYLLSGEGETPLKSIADKALADKVYKIARSFEPAD